MKKPKKLQNFTQTVENQTEPNPLSNVNPKRKTLFIALGLLIFLIVLYRDFIFGKYAYVYKGIGSDSYNYTYLLFYHYAEYLQQIGTPKWSFQVGMGQSIHPTWFCPVIVPLLYFFKTNIAEGMVYIPVIYGFLGGVVFYKYLEILRIQFYPAIIGTITYLCCGHLVLAGTWSPEIFPSDYLMLPLMLYGIESQLQHKKWYFFPLAICLMAIRYPFNLFTFGFLAIAYLIVRSIREEKGFDWLFFIKQIGIFSLLGLIGLGLGSFQFLSNVLQIYESPRVTGEHSFTDKLSNFPVLGVENSIHYVTALLRTFSIDFLGNSDKYQGWQNYLEGPIFYAGLINLLLVPQLFLFATPIRRKIYGAILGIIVLMVLFPFFRYTFWLFAGDYYRTFSLFVSLVLILFAAKSLNSIYEKNQINLIILAISVVVLVGIVSFVGDKSVVNSSTRFVTAFLLATYGVFLLGVKSNTVRNFSLIALLLLVIGEAFFSSNSGIYKRNIALKSDFTTEGLGMKDGTTKVMDYLKNTDKTFYRIEKDFSSGISKFQTINDSQAQNFYGTKAYHGFNQINYINFLSAVEIVNPDDERTSRWTYGFLFSPLMSKLCSVKYFLSNATQTDSTRKAFWGIPIHKEEFFLDSLTTIDDVILYRNPYSLPLGVCFDSYILPENFEKMTINGKRQNLLQSLVLDKNIDKKFLVEVKNPHEELFMNEEFVKNWTTKHSDTLQISEFSANQIKGKINLNKAQMLFLSIPFDTGWSAKLNNQEVKIEKVNYGLMGLHLPQGINQIELKYEPPFVKLGGYISLISSLLFILGLFLWIQTTQKTQNRR